MDRSNRHQQIAANQKVVLSVASAALLLALAGCGSSSAIKLEDYLEEIEFEVPLNSASEVPLGKYSIPIAARSNQESLDEQQATWVQLKFDLYAVVAPENESALLTAWERHQGLYYDGALKICRSASLDDVLDPRLASIKSHLTDLSRMIFGKKRIRQLLCTNIVTEAI